MQHVAHITQHITNTGVIPCNWPTRTLLQVTLLSTVSMRLLITDKSEPTTIPTLPVIHVCNE